MISIKKKSSIPKYKQIITAIENAILNGELKKGDQLPSINTLKNKNKLSRDTVLTAFNDLKNRGIIQSVVGKGYYVSSENINVQQKIFLLFDELNSFKEDLYNSFLENLGEHIQVDIFFHHFNQKIFDKLINDNSGDYNYYVIMPANFKNTSKIIEILPKDKVYILDQIHEDLENYPSIYQNFEKTIYTNLNTISGSIKKYQKLNLIALNHNQPKSLIKGFVQFCEEKEIPFEIIEKTSEQLLTKGELFIIPDDKSLLRIIKKMKKQNFVLGQDIGVISYNDTLLKEIVEGGITTITTDFNEMGKRLAQMILNKEQLKIENPNKLIIRNSI
ncbi:GntR family transcriptional regulator [Polaribacter sp. SA4-12]|uniref:GntR family transcriptional regulator n=1 Tax=Polaribacter sp. SA4-12 TaxID=1312072 RepID=UPI000B3C4815|nr:GntR family transcriptional regulator [Polaribacter sp. SA4-12]ARV16194.1 transcriptional regulator [Polaribacter sp. SA4-12]